MAKNLPGGLNLEKCIKEFESHGFHTLGLLKYLLPRDLDAFFLSPGKLLLTENTSWKAKTRGLLTQKGREQRQDHQNFLRDSTVLVGRIVIPLLATQMLPSNLSPLPDVSTSTIATTPATPQSLQLLPFRKINHWIETPKRIEMKETLLALEDCSFLIFKNINLLMESNLSRPVTAMLFVDSFEEDERKLEQLPLTFLQIT